MSTQSERLQEARKKAGFTSAAQVAERFGWTYNTYLSHENGARGFRLNAARKYARAFNVPVGWLMLTDKEPEEPDIATVNLVRLEGEVAAGVWIEAEDSLPLSDVLIPASPNPDYPPDIQVALKVRGNSMNKIFRDGEYVIAALYGYTRDVRDRDIVIIRRQRAGMVETTLKRYRKQNNRVLLVPESTDPAFQTPLDYSAPEEGTTVEIYAIAIGKYENLS